MEILDYTRCCRFCLQQDVVTKLILHSDIYELVSNCASVQISVDDGLPKQICMLCASELNRLIQFRNLCRKSDMMLRLIGNVLEELENEKSEPVEMPESENAQFNTNFESDRSTSGAVLKTSQSPTIDCTVTEPMLPRVEFLRAEETSLGTLLSAAPRREGNTTAVVISSSENSRDSDVVCVESSKPSDGVGLGYLRQTNAGRKQTGKYKCELCNKCFSSRYGLARHEKEVVHNKPKLPNVNINLERCNICDHWFMCRANLEAHVLERHIYDSQST